VRQRVLIRGHGKAAVSVARLAALRTHDVTLVTPESVLAPELGLPGRFRLVHDTEAAGAHLHHGVADEPPELRLGTQTEVRIAPGEPRLEPELPMDVDLYVIGDASGTVGLAAAFEQAKLVAEAL
jgi:hypothetical protein